MFAVQSTFGRRLSALACALTLAILLTGNVAAFQPERDNTGPATLVTPKLIPANGSSQWVRFKLATPAGHQVLVYG
jgi:hypothetical protein